MWDLNLLFLKLYKPMTQNACIWNKCKLCNFIFNKIKRYTSWWWHHIFWSSTTGFFYHRSKDKLYIPKTNLEIPYLISIRIRKLLEIVRICICIVVSILISHPYLKLLPKMQFFSKAQQHFGNISPYLFNLIWAITNDEKLA